MPLEWSRQLVFVSESNSSPLKGEATPSIEMPSKSRRAKHTDP